MSEILAEYEIGALIGKGSFSEVFSGINRRDQQKVAIKIVNKEALGEKNLPRIVSEVNILQSISHHPNIVTLLNHYEDEKKVYLITELCEGGDLYEQISMRDFHSEREAQALLRSLASTLLWLHEHKIVHRDIKPENIFLSHKADNNSSSSSVLKLGDFGFAKAVDSDSSFMFTSLGSMEYTAPEILLHLPYTAKVDAWSFGVVAFTLLCGYSPFYGEDKFIVLDKVQNGRVEFDPVFWDSVSDRAKDLVQCLLVVNPDHRLSMKQVVEHPFFVSTASDKDITPVLSELQTLLTQRRGGKNVAQMARDRLNDLLQTKSRNNYNS